jgi:adenylate kinase
MLLVALTGTPGTGKSAVAHMLEREDCMCIYLEDVVRAHELYIGYDALRDTMEVDMAGLEALLEARLKTWSDVQPIFLVGHYAHCLLLQRVRLVIVLRCHPAVLRERLETRGYAESKISENIEAEALDVILVEAVELHGIRKVYEIDTTELTPSVASELVLQLLTAVYRPSQAEIDAAAYRAGSIDWSAEVLKWY